MFTTQFRQHATGFPGRIFTVVSRQPSWVIRAALIAAAITLTAVVALLVIPALLIGLVVLLAALLIARVRTAFHRLRAPNGALDGRRNVRVIVRPDESSGA